MANNIHMGEIVESVFNTSDLTKTELGHRIGCKHNNIINIFRRQTIDPDLLQRLSDALNHDFMYLYSSYGSSAANDAMAESEDAKERIPSLSKFGLCSVDNKRFASIVKEYVSGEYKKPLVVLAYNSSDDAHDIALKESRKVHGTYVSCNTTDLQSFRYTPHKVYILSEGNARKTGDDVDTYLGKVIDAKRKSNKHLIYIVDIPRYNLDSTEEYNDLEVALKQRYSLWRNNVHMVCLDSTQTFTNRRKELQHNHKVFEFDSSIAANVCKLTDGEKQVIADCSDETVYSDDGKRLLKASLASGVFEVKAGTEIVCNEVFKDNTLVTKVILPDSVKCLGKESFAGCKELLQIVMPTKIDVIGEGCFTGCAKLTRVVMPKELRYIGRNAFEECRSLKAIDMPATLRTIGRRAFRGTGLCSVSLSHDGDDVCDVGDNAFEDCKNLQTMTIASNVNIPSPSVFSDCNSLTEIVFNGKRPGIGELVEGLTAVCPSLERITYDLK